jgi:NitT/TauT family transport system permease protein
MTVDAVEDVDRRYLEMGLLSGMSPFNSFLFVVIPSTLPRIVDILRINLSGAWTFLVAAEVVGAQGGLGHLIAISQRFGRIETLYVGILTFGLIGLMTDYTLQLFTKMVFKWRH